MHPLAKKLAQQTAIYGLSSIIGRFLNYALVPIHTRIFLPQEYGVITEFFAYVAFLNILFTYGMETAFFRFAAQADQKKRAYDTALVSILTTSILFAGTLALLSPSIASALRYPDHAEYVVWFALILGLDAVCAIPFARLRQENRPLRFAAFKIFNIAINVGFNLFFLIACPWILETKSMSGLHSVISVIYDPGIGVGYVFIANLLASAATLLLFLPRYIIFSTWEVDRTLLKKMLRYALPLLIVGLAGMIDETLSRAILKYRLPVPHDEAMRQLGIFGACYKISILMTLFIQAYRMAAEPFFFEQSTREHPQPTYAKTMTYFVIFCSFIFLFVMLFADVFKMIFITPAYYEGMKVVPVLLLANFFLGIYYNLTIWYKLTDRTATGALVAVYGAVLTIALNWWWIPVFGYVGSAWATFTVYGSMVIISYFLGQKFYPVPYDLKRIFAYIALAVLFYLADAKLVSLLAESLWMVKYLYAFAFMALYILIVVVIERRSLQGFRPG